MVGLIDIAPSFETVPVAGKKIDIPGVSAKGIASLLARFPELRALLLGRQIEVDKLIAMGGDAVAAIIAAGTGAAGDDKAEAVAATLPIETQVDLLSAIIKVTMPQGLNFLVDKLTSLGGLLSVQAAAPVPTLAERAMRSRKRSTG